jgi:hypothetical protein
MRRGRLSYTAHARTQRYFIGDRLFHLLFFHMQERAIEPLGRMTAYTEDKDAGVRFSSVFVF